MKSKQLYGNLQTYSILGIFTVLIITMIVAPNTISPLFSGPLGSRTLPPPGTNNLAPENPYPELRLSNNNLVCSSLITDPNNDPLIVEIEWYEDSTLKHSEQYNRESGTIFTATMDSSYLNQGEVWYCKLRLYDDLAYSDWGTSNSITISDNSAPILSFINQPGSKVSGTVTISVQADDNNLDNVQILLNNDIKQVCTTSQCSVDIDTTQLPGVNQIKARATDTYDNTAELPLELIFDNQPPVITIASPQNTIYTNNLITLSTSADETVEWSYQLNSGQETVFSPGKEITGASGLNTITIIAKDEAGNINTDETQFTISQSTAAYELEFQSPTPEDSSFLSTDSYPVTLKFKHDNTPTSCTLILNNNEYEMSFETLNDYYFCHKDLDSLSDSLYSYKVIVKDSTTETESVTREVTIDTTKPSITMKPIVYQNQPAQDSDKITITATVTDSLSGVDEVKIDANDIGCSYLTLYKTTGDEYSNDCVLSNPKYVTQLEISVKDLAGNEKKETFTIDIADTSSTTTTTTQEPEPEQAKSVCGDYICDTGEDCPKDCTVENTDCVLDETRCFDKSIEKCIGDNVWEEIQVCDEMCAIIEDGPVCINTRPDTLPLIAGLIGIISLAAIIIYVKF